MFEVRLNAPLHVEWEITNACNLRCRHCYASAGDKASGELTTKEALDLVAELDSTGAADVTLSGGEPFLRKDLWQILRALNSRGIPFIIYTNGTLLDHRRVKKLSQTGVASYQ